MIGQKNMFNSSSGWRYLGCICGIAALLFLLISSDPIIRCTSKKIMLTAALTDAHYEFRQQQYIESFNILKVLGYENFYVVEALKKQGPTFLDDYSKHVFYSTVNGTCFRNQGINEARTSLEATYHFKFESEDMIIKLTGRHLFLSDYFLKLVANNPDYDAFVKIDDNGDVFTVCFAMKCKYFQEMYEHMDFNNMEVRWINLEHEVGNYIKQKVREGQFKVYYVDKLDVKADNFGSSTAPGAPHNIIIL